MLYHGRGGGSRVHLDSYDVVDGPSAAAPAVGAGTCSGAGQRPRLDIFSGTASAAMFASLALCFVLVCAYSYRARRRAISGTRRRFLEPCATSTSSPGQPAAPTAGPGTPFLPCGAPTPTPAPPATAQCASSPCAAAAATSGRRTRAATCSTRRASTRGSAVATPAPCAGALSAAGVTVQTKQQLAICQRSWSWLPWRRRRRRVPELMAMRCRDDAEIDVQRS